MNNHDSSGDIAAIVIEALRRERMTLDEALQIIKRGEEHAKTIGVPMVIAVVDDGGNLVAVHRMDDSLLAGISISQSKAYTAAALQVPTEEAAETILPGQPLYGLQQTHPGKFCIFGGGLPILHRGRCIGAVGVSGGTVEQDIAVARYAADY